MNEPECPGEGWERNPGHQPEHTRGKRIATVLHNGRKPSIDPVTVTAPPGWAADKSNWAFSRRHRDFDIFWFRVL